MSHTWGRALVTRSYNMNFAVISRCWMAFCFFEALNLLCISLTTLAAAKSYDLTRPSETSSASHSYLGFLAVATSGLMLWLSFIPRLVFWRWSACFTDRLRWYATSMVLSVTFWSLASIAIASWELLSTAENIFKASRAFDVRLSCRLETGY